MPLSHPRGGDLGRPSGSSAVTPRKGCASPAPTEGDAHVPAESDRAIIVATVQGDIHDIGKNIVKMLLENYGFTVIDLGRDVAPEAVVAAARDTRARLIGLSALMTTTVGAMERTIASRSRAASRRRGHGGRRGHHPGVRRPDRRRLLRKGRRRFHPRRLGLLR